MRLSNECEQVVGKIIRGYNMNDDTSALVSFLERDNTMQSNLLLLPLVIEIEDYELYESYKERLDEEILGSENVAGIFLFYDIMKDLRQSERQIKELTEDELAQITELAQSELIVASYAKSLLDFLGIQVWDHPVTQLPEETSYATYSQEKIMQDQNDLLVYPNPVNTSFKVVIHTERELKNGHIYIYTVNGKKVYTAKIRSSSAEITIDALGLNLADGLYIIKVEDQNGYQGSAKFVFKR